MDGWIEDGTDDRSSHFTQCVEIRKREREREYFALLTLLPLFFILLMTPDNLFNTTFYIKLLFNSIYANTTRITSG